ncbi:MAG: DUF1028 domain-containing protein [Thermoprotei archaeon]|nr:MAG: DUF1028 domain-containing protein [Thermoprotei archaeon]
MTYSIVALSSNREMLGVAVASGSLAVGSRVPWAKVGVGAVATQAYTNPALGPIILKLLSKGYSAENALKKALERDKEPEKRQVAVIDYKGNKAYHNGALIPKNYGAYIGENCACIGNLIVNTEIPKAMCKTFEKKYGEDFIYALLLALVTAHRLGGDRRGDRSAALLVVSETPYGELYDRVVDLRVDYSPNPVQELIELYEIHKALR